MDRFFSKLDLRDIKIKPEGNRFLPTDDEQELDDQVESPQQGGNFVADSPIASAATIERTREQRVAESMWQSETEADAPHETLPDRLNGEELQRTAIPSDQAIYDNGEVLKVSAKSRPSAVAGAIAGVVRDAGRAEVQAIGAGATNQAVKAVAIARDYLQESGIDAVCVPAFIDVTIDDEERTAIRLVVETR